MIEIDLKTTIPNDELAYIENNISKQHLFIKANKVFINKIKISDLDKIPNLVQLLKENALFYNIKANFRIYYNYNKDQKIVNKQATRVARQSSFYQQAPLDKTTNELSEQFLNKIICGDAYQVLKQIPNNSIDVVITSPPYNFGITYDNYCDRRGWNNYFKQMEKIIKQLFRVLKYGGRIIWNIQPFYNEYVPSHHIFSQLFLKSGFIWRNEILWEKNNFSARYTSWGSWLSASSPYLKYTWEFIEVYSKGSIKKPQGAYKSDLSEDEFKQWTIGKWSIAPERNMKLFGHDAMFPEKLVMRAIKLFSFPKDIILDPFNGVGTTTKVAKDLNRNFVGIDISKKYCQVANERIDGVFNGKK